MKNRGKNTGNQGGNVGNRGENSRNQVGNLHVAAFHTQGTGN